MDKYQIFGSIPITYYQLEPKTSGEAYAFDLVLENSTFAMASLKESDKKKDAANIRFHLKNAP